MRWILVFIIPFIFAAQQDKYVNANDDSGKVILRPKDAGGNWVEALIADAVAGTVTIFSGMSLSTDSISTGTVTADTVNVDTINEKTAANGVAIDGALIKDNDVTADEVFTDTITEKTGAAGVTIEGVLAKDNDVTATGVYADDAYADEIRDKAGTGDPAFPEGLEVPGKGDTEDAPANFEFAEVDFITGHNTTNEKFPIVHQTLGIGYGEDGTPHAQRLTILFGGTEQSDYGTHSADGYKRFGDSGKGATILSGKIEVYRTTGAPNIAYMKLFARQNSAAQAILSLVGSVDGSNNDTSSVRLGGQTAVVESRLVLDWTSVTLTTTGYTINPPTKSLLYVYSNDSSYTASFSGAGCDTGVGTWLQGMKLTVVTLGSNNWTLNESFNHKFNGPLAFNPGDTAEFICAADSNWYGISFSDNN